MPSAWAGTGTHRVGTRGPFPLDANRSQQARSASNCAEINEVSIRPAWRIAGARGKVYPLALALRTRSPCAQEDEGAVTKINRSNSEANVRAACVFTRGLRLDLRGLAGYLSLSRRTPQDLVNDPTDPLPTYRVGAKLLVRRSEADAWMARRRNRKPLAAARLAAADAHALLTARPKR